MCIVKEQTITQPVTTPVVLSVSLIRETLNPTPRPDATSAEWREHGYRDAMLDAYLAEVADDESDLGELINVANDVIAYGEVEWHTTEWDDDAVNNLGDLLWEIDQAI